MKPKIQISEAEMPSAIEPRSVPKTMIHWPSAFRLKPAKLPATQPLAILEPEGVESLISLKDMTSPSARHREKSVLLQHNMPVGVSETVVSAFATSVPEWRFAARGTAHMVLASSIAAAISVASEIYGQFLRDTNQPTSCLSFSVERFCLTGNFADVCERETFPSCYEDQNKEAPQGLVNAFSIAGEDGLIFESSAGQAAIVLNPQAITRGGLERAVALEWSGSQFHRAFDYRDMYWRDLAS